MGNSLVIKKKVRKMEKEDTKFTEQQAPEKNTDGAFVQVGKDGQPVIPEGEKNDEAKKNQPEPGSLKDR